jgi:hypothetical protein
MELDNLQVSLWRAALIHRASAADCDELIALGDKYGRRLTMRMALAAKVLCLVGDSAATDHVFKEMADLNNGSLNWRSWLDSFAGLIHAAHSGNSELIERIRREWDSRRPSWTPNKQVVDRVFVFIGYAPMYPKLGSIDGADAARIDQRWQEIIVSLVN